VGKQQVSLAAALVFAAACGQDHSSVCDTEQGVRICADGATVKGVDVSIYQGAVDWAKVKAAGMTFAFARISDGTRSIDSQFPRNWPGMKAAGLVRGAYQYFRASQDPVAQADIVVDKILAAGGLDDTDLPPVIDLEETDGQTSATVVANAKAWIARIESRLQRRPIMYSGNNMATVTGNNFSAYPLWVPNYTTQCPLVPSGWTRWAFWQNSSTGSVSGISGNVDTDFFNGDATALAAFVRSTNLAPPPAVDGGEPPPDLTPPGPPPMPDGGCTP
jgi:lysozyme